MQLGKIQSDKSDLINLMLEMISSDAVRIRVNYYTVEQFDP